MRRTSSPRTGLRIKKFLRVVAVFVVVVDDAVGRAEAIEAEDGAAAIDGGVEHFAWRTIGRLLVLHVEEQFEGIARPDAAAEVGIEGVDAQNLLDRLGRQALHQTGMIDARVER